MGVTGRHRPPGIRPRAQAVTCFRWLVLSRAFKRGVMAQPRGGGRLGVGWALTEDEEGGRPGLGTGVGAEAGLGRRGSPGLASWSCRWHRMGAPNDHVSWVALPPPLLALQLCWPDLGSVGPGLRLGLGFLGLEAGPLDTQDNGAGSQWGRDALGMRGGQCGAGPRWGPQGPAQQAPAWSPGRPGRGDLTLRVHSSSRLAPGLQGGGWCSEAPRPVGGDSSKCP